MVRGQHGHNVLHHATVVPNSELDHMTVALPMISKLLSVAQLVPIQCGHNGQDVLYATILANHQLWLNVHAVTLAQPNKISKRKHVLHHDVHIGLSGVAGEHAQLHVVMDLELEFALVLDLINFVKV